MNQLITNKIKGSVGVKSFFRLGAVVEEVIIYGKPQPQNGPPFPIPHPKNPFHQTPETNMIGFSPSKLTSSPHLPTQDKNLKGFRV